MKASTSQRPSRTSVMLADTTVKPALPSSFESRRIASGLELKSAATPSDDIVEQRGAGTAPRGGPQQARPEPRCYFATGIAGASGSALVRSPHWLFSMQKYSRISLPGSPSFAVYVTSNGLVNV